jgi:pimeloyl-ACP methyl ester carboxylesterase
VTACAVSEHDLEVKDGRLLRIHDAGGEPGAFTLLWHHGSPQTGALLEPLVSAAEARGIRLLSYARPSYGGSTPLPGSTMTWPSSRRGAST